MANELILPPPPAWLAVAGAAIDNQDLYNNVGESFPTLSIRSGKFFLRYQGTEQPILNPMGQLTPYIDVTIVKAGSNIVKTWYVKGYQQGDREAPDCFSNDGKAPDPDAPNTPVDPRTGAKVQFCGTCPNNVWGSAPARPDGKGGFITTNAKACADRRNVIVLLRDATPLGGEIIPVLLRLPPTSLKPMADYGRHLENAGYPYQAVLTRLSFATENYKGKDVGYPLLKFEIAQDQMRGENGILSQSDFAFVKKMETDPRVERMLRAKQDGVNADAPRADMQDRFTANANQAYAAIGGQEQVQAAPVSPPPMFTQPAPVQAAPQPAPVQAAPALIELPDGRWYNPATKQYVEPPAPSVPARPESVIELPDGKLYDMATKQYWPTEFVVPAPAPAPQPQAAPPAPAPAPLVGEVLQPGQNPPASLFGGGVVPLRQPAPVETQAQPAQQPTTAEAQAKVGRPKKVSAEPKTEPTPASNGNGSEKVVSPSTPALDSIIASLKGSGVPPE